MDQIATPGRVAGSTAAPASKSYAQRAIAAALLSSGTTTLTNMVLCNDTRAALEVARALGATIAARGDTYAIGGSFLPHATHLHVGESGLATRLFTPIACLGEEPIVIQGEGSLLRRPIAMMEQPLTELGAHIATHKGYLPITVQGPLHGGEIWVDGSLSSQFITGLLMALPLAEQDTVLHVESLKSRPYVDMTLSVAEAFGVRIEHNNYEQFFIPGGQNYLPITYNIEGDWSGASCLLVAGATAGEVTLTNLSTLSLQADGAIIEALTRAGAEIITTADSVSVRRSALNSFTFDATHCPDLFPALVALAASCSGTTTLHGAHRLKFKESDRAQALAEVFGRMGIEVDLSQEDVMRITGGPMRGATVSSHNDHRIAMAAAVAALNCAAPVVIQEAEAVEKSYPEFWSELALLTHPVNH